VVTYQNGGIAMNSKRRFQGRLLLVAIGLLVSLPVVFFFQNCSQTGFEGNTQGSEEFASQALADDSVGVPFAYSVGLDQITYNSCAYDSMPSNQPGMFTLHAGAFVKGGAKLRPEFLSWARSTIKPIYPAQTVSDAQVKEFISKNRSLSGAIPQLAIRGRQSPQTLFPLGKTSTASINVDYVNLLGDLADDRWLSTLIQQANLNSNLGVNYFPLAPGGSRIFEGRLFYNKAASDRSTLINNLSSSFQLTVTYKSEKGDLYAARAPSGSDPAQAYGQGYNLQFSQGPSAYQQTVFQGSNIWSGSLVNVLSKVEEVPDLRNPSVVNSTAWVCSSDYRFMIVQKEFASTHCPEEDFSITSNASNRSALAMVRRSLKPEDWHVNLQYRCVVPKNATCYMPEQLSGQPIPVQYDASKPCFAPGNGQNALEVCPQYISICYRNQD
jgi:hypothetical protein